MRGFWRIVPLWVLACVAVAAPAAWAAEVRGTLHQDGGRPVLVTPEGGKVALEGVADAIKVLLDKRLKGMEIGASGRQSGREKFRIGPFNKKSTWVWKDGKRYEITYWCEVCAVRAYTPGPCQCCQEYTELNLVEIHEHSGD